MILRGDRPASRQAELHRSVSPRFPTVLAKVQAMERQQFWTFEQAYRLLLCGSEEITDAFPGGSLRDGVAFASRCAQEGQFPFLRSGDTAKKLLIRAAETGHITLYGVHSDGGSLSEIPRHTVISGRVDLGNNAGAVLRGARAAIQWSTLSVLRSEALRLAYEHSEGAEFDAALIKWLDIRGQPWLSLPDAVRLVVERRLGDEGEEAAAIMASSQWEASPRLTGERLERTREAVAWAREAILRRLQHGKPGEPEAEDGEGSPIRASQWCGLPVDWQRSALGPKAGVLIPRELLAGISPEAATEEVASEAPVQVAAPLPETRRGAPKGARIDDAAAMAEMYRLMQEEGMGIGEASLKAAKSAAGGSTLESKAKRLSRRHHDAKKLEAEARARAMEPGGELGGSQTLAPK